MNRECRLTDRLVVTAKPDACEYSVRDTVCKGIALRVQPTGARTWILRGLAADPRQRHSLGDASSLTVDDARRIAHAILSGSRPPPSVLRRQHALTFRKFVRTYLDRRVMHWKPSTTLANRKYLRNTLLPAFGRVPLGEVREVAVRRWFHRYGEKSPGGANRALTVLRDIINRAVEWGALPPTHPNPCKGIKPHRRPPRGRLLNPEAIARLWSALEAEPPENRTTVDAIRLLMLTGCRLREILDLRWEDIGTSALFLRDAKAGPRQVELAPAVIEILRLRRLSVTSGWVFPARGSDDRPAARPISVWNRLRAVAGLPADARIHDLRHTFASVALMSGETMRATGELLGHRNQQSTARYAHMRSEYLHDAAETISARIAAMMGDHLIVGAGIEPPASLTDVRH